MNVGKNLQLIREINNYTQSYVAEYIGVNQKTYSTMEKAENNISVEILLKLTKLYQISLAKILELNAEAILNTNTQNGGIGYFNNHGSYYNGEKEMYHQIIQQQEALISSQQKFIEDINNSK